MARLSTPPQNGVFQCKSCGWYCKGIRCKVSYTHLSDCNWYSIKYMHFAALGYTSWYFRYYVFTSKHLEGYPMWPSTYSFGYNSMDVGPKRDIVGELERAFRLNHPDIHFGLYYCLWEFENPIWLKDLANNKTTR